MVTSTARAGTSRCSRWDKMKKLLSIILMLLAIIPAVIAGTTYTLTAPADLTITTDTSMLFNWTVVVTGATVPGMTTWVYLSPVNNKTGVINTTAVVSNNTWRNVTISGLSVGFYKWYLVTNTSAGNTTSTMRWFEVRDTTNQTYFRWENESGFQAMKLDKNLGDLTVTRNTVVGGQLNASGATNLFSTLSVNGTATPYSNASFNLGSISLLWKQLFVNDITAFNDINATGKMNAATLNTGQGDNELYAMNQNVRTSDTVTFGGVISSGDVNATAEMNAATLNTGQGDNELYAMNQNVRTTDAVTFAGMTSNGNVVVTGNLTVIGSEIVANVTNLNVNGSVLPYLSDTFTLGGSAQIWNHIYGNILTIADIIASDDINTTGKMNAATLNTGQGDNELYAMSQNVRSTDNVTFNNVSATYFNGNSTWQHQSYPSACPANSAITLLGDAVTCTDGLYTYVQMAANIGNWSADKASYALDSRVTAVNNTANSLGNWSADKASYALDSRVTLVNDTANSLGNWSADKASYLALAGGTMTGNIIMNSKNVTGATYFNVASQDISGQLNMTGSNQVIWFANNASITTNATCLLLRSPNGSGVQAVCDT